MAVDAIHQRRRWAVASVGAIAAWEDHLVQSLTLQEPDSIQSEPTGTAQAAQRKTPWFKRSLPEGKRTCQLHGRHSGGKLAFAGTSAPSYLEGWGSTSTLGAAPPVHTPCDRSGQGLRSSSRATGMKMQQISSGRSPLPVTRTGQTAHLQVSEKTHSRAGASAAAPSPSCLRAEAGSEDPALRWL